MSTPPKLKKTETQNAFSALGPEPKNGTMAWAKWSAQKMKIERETVRGFLESLDATDRAILNKDALDQNCGDSGDGNPEELAVRWLRSRLVSIKSTSHRLTSRHIWCNDQIVARVGIGRMVQAVRAHMDLAHMRCIVIDKKNPLAPLVASERWLTGHAAEGRLQIDLRKRVGEDSWTDTSDDLTEGSLSAFLLGRVRPAGKIAK